jgi:hypothetical protein
MTSDTDTLPSEPTTTPHESLTSPRNGSEPAFLARARRILGGDIQPEDYLAVTPEVRRRVDLFLQAAHARGNGQAIAPEVEPRQLQEEVLSFHHGGQNIVYFADDRGVIVLAVGLEQSSLLIETFPDRINGRVCFGAPMTDELWI